jgi:hypothetical protein
MPVTPLCVQTHRDRAPDAGCVCEARAIDRAISTLDFSGRRRRRQAASIVGACFMACSSARVVALALRHVSKRVCVCARARSCWATSGRAGQLGPSPTSIRRKDPAAVARARYSSVLRMEGLGAGGVETARCYALRVEQVACPPAVRRNAVRTHEGVTHARVVSIQHDTAVATSRHAPACSQPAAEGRWGIFLRSIRRAGAEACRARCSRAPSAWNQRILPHGIVLSVQSRRNRYPPVGRIRDVRVGDGVDAVDGS